MEGFYFYILIIFTTFKNGNAIFDGRLLTSIQANLKEIVACRCQCGLPNRGPRMRGGEFSTGHEFPWLATIRILNKISVNAVLINKRYILTSASPLIGVTPYDVKVTLGHYDVCNPEVSSSNLSVSGIFVHPDYLMFSRANDLAILKLSNDVYLERRIATICLPTQGSTYLGQVGTAVSWGEETSPDGSTFPGCRPKKLGLPILGKLECSHSVADFYSFGKDKGCAGVLGGPSYICQADVGSPLMYRNKRGIYELIGSFTDKNDCGIKLTTAMYTMINYHLSWIKHTTRDSCYCSRP